MCFDLRWCFRRVRDGRHVAVVAVVIAAAQMQLVHVRVQHGPLRQAADIELLRSRAIMKEVEEKRNQQQQTQKKKWKISEKGE